MIQFPLKHNVRSFAKETMMASVQTEKQNLSANFPVWFKPKPGFKFRDVEGNPYIVIGRGGRRSGLVAAYRYEGEWHTSIFTALAFDAQEGWTPEQEATLDGWK